MPKELHLWDGVKSVCYLQLLRGWRLYDSDMDWLWDSGFVIIPSVGHGFLVGEMNGLSCVCFKELF